MIKYPLFVLFSVLFLSCGSNETKTTENIEFNGLKASNSTYKVNILRSEGKGSLKNIIDERITSAFEFDLNLSDADSLKYIATISRLKYEHSGHSLFKYIFDTDLDTVAVTSSFVDIEFKENEKKKVKDALAVLKKIKGKSIVTALNKEGVLELEKNEISTKDFSLDSYYNPEEVIEKIFNPSDLLTLVDFVFYPELGTYNEGEEYEVKGVLDSFTFSYKNAQRMDNVLYSKRKFRRNVYRRVDSKIDKKSNTLLESKFTERIQKGRSNIGLNTIIKKEIIVQKTN